MNDSTHPTRTVRVGGRRIVTETFYDDLRARLTDLEPGLEPHRAYKVQEILGEEFWDEQDKYTKVVIGACVAQMVRRGEVPLAFVKCECAVPKRYRTRRT